MRITFSTYRIRYLQSDLYRSVVVSGLFSILGDEVHVFRLLNLHIKVKLNQKSNKSWVNVLKTRNANIRRLASRFELIIYFRLSAVLMDVVEF